MYGLFACLFFVPLDNFSFIWRHHHWWLRAANFDLCSAPMAIEQWEFLKVPYLLWHEASINNGHLWASVRLSLIAERLAVELSLPDIYNFGRPFLDYHYYMLSLFDPCPRVDKKWRSLLYDLYGHVLSQEHMYWGRRTHDDWRQSIYLSDSSDLYIKLMWYISLLNNRYICRV